MNGLNAALGRKRIPPSLARDLRERASIEVEDREEEVLGLTGPARRWN